MWSYRPARCHGQTTNKHQNNSTSAVRRSGSGVPSGRTEPTATAKSGSSRRREICITLLHSHEPRNPNKPSGTEDQGTLRLHLSGSEINYRSAALRSSPSVFEGGFCVDFHFFFFSLSVEVCFTVPSAPLRLVAECGSVGFFFRQPPRPPSFSSLPPYLPPSSLCPSLPPSLLSPSLLPLSLLPSAEFVCRPPRSDYRGP